MPHARNVWYDIMGIYAIVYHGKDHHFDLESR